MLRFILLLCMLGVPLGFVAAKGKKITKIVLDAGHGGQDTGAEGEVSKEKDLTLAITLKLGKIIADSLKDVTIIYTRTVDEYPSLRFRHELANKANADLFVAVHVNATPWYYKKVVDGYRKVKKHGKTVKQAIYHTVKKWDHGPHGTETYVLGLSRTGQQKGEFSKYSNNVGDSSLIDMSKPETAIILDQYTQAYLGRSIALGGKIQAQFAAQGRYDGGVKQMNLEVLAGSTMPGVLVETGFISNDKEEAYLNSEKGQMEVAMAIFEGIKAYKDGVER